MLERWAVDDESFWFTAETDGAAVAGIFVAKYLLEEGDPRENGVRVVATCATVVHGTRTRSGRRGGRRRVHLDQLSFVVLQLSSALILKWTHVYNSITTQDSTRYS